MSLRFSPESKQPNRALREWESSEMRRQHEARVKSAKSEYGPLFRANGPSPGARSPAPRTPGVASASNAETRRARATPTRDTARPAAHASPAPATPSSRPLDDAGTPGVDIPHGSGSRIRAAAAVALSPDSRYRAACASPIAPGSSLGGSRVGRASPAGARTGASPHSRLPAPPSAARETVANDTPPSASVASVSSASSSGRPSTGRSVARFLRRRQELRLKQRALADPATDIVDAKAAATKTLAADKENVDPEWSEFESPGATAKTAATVETVAEHSFSPLETYGTVCEDEDEEDAADDVRRRLHRDDVADPEEEDEEEGFENHLAAAASRGEERYAAEEEEETEAEACSNRDDAALALARETESRLARLVIPARDPESDSPPGHRLGAKGHAYAAFAAALAEYERDEVYQPREPHEPPTPADTPSPLRTFNPSAPAADRYGPPLGASSPPAAAGDDDASSAWDEYEGNGDEIFSLGEEEDLSPFKMVSPSVLKRAAAAHARSLSLKRGCGLEDLAAEEMEQQEEEVEVGPCELRRYE